MQARYARGTGTPPTFLSRIIRKSASKGEIVFVEAGGQEVRITFDSTERLLSILSFAMKERVPFSVGSHGLGGAEEISMLVSSGEIVGDFIEISWTSPSNWIVREMRPNTKEWKEFSDARMIANHLFTANLIK